MKPIFPILLVFLTVWSARGQAAEGVAQAIPFEPLPVITGPGYLEAVTTNNAAANTGENGVRIANTAVTQTGGRVNLTFQISGSNGAPFDVFASTALANPITNSHWTWMGQGYSGVTYKLAGLSDSSIWLLLGTPQDSDGDGLTDAYELLVSHSNPYVSNSINASMLDSWAVRLNLNPFGIYDQDQFPGAPQVRLGYWQFNGSYTGQEGEAPLASQNDALVPDWSGDAVSMTNAAESTLAYNVIDNGGQTNFSPGNGTIRFWFQPNWSNGSSNEPTWIYGSSFLYGQADDGFWQLGFQPISTNIYLLFFATRSNQCVQPWSFKTGGFNGAPITFESNLWYQIALTYSPSNVAVYTNGILFDTANWAPSDAGGPRYDLGNGVVAPEAGDFQSGFGFGCLPGQPEAILGQLDELETFNYPLSPEAVAAGFPGFAGSTYDVMTDSDYDGRSDMLEILVDGTNPGDPRSVARCRLGYWRFDTADLMAEQGQLPLSLNDVSIVPDWSGSSLNIGSDAGSQVTYWDVFTNGWANINCRQGCLRFWFKPNWNGGPPSTAPFVYMGNPNPAASQWALKAGPGGVITFVTASNNVLETNLMTGPLSFDAGHWTQIVLNYGPNGTSLYTNGELAATGGPVTMWPDLADRNLGMVIGNSTAYNNSINGQFDEMETFNYQLDPSSILGDFQIVQAVDSDLDGVPDLLEDIALPVARPFTGAPVVITGTMEAEQFDMGGPGVAYHSVAANPPSAYRPTGMFITNCDDLGLGYCLDQTRAGDWVQYTINVLVAQTYTVEARVAGIGNNGVFECEFSNAGFYTNTGPMTIPTTNWTNVSATVYLPCGTNIMRLHCLTNGTDGQHVGKFNYISIYPWWQTGFVSTHTNVVAASQLSANNDWKDAVNNAAVIQSSVNNMAAAGGGTVLLPSGSYFVSQIYPNETNDTFANTAVTIITNNIEIAGAGKNATTLIGYNRATTIFSVGRATNGLRYGCTNFTLRDMTIEAQPHLAVEDVTNTAVESGQLVNLPYPYDYYTGHSTVFNGAAPDQLTCNLLITNCQFLYGDVSIGIVGFISNCAIAHCDFNIWGGSNVYTGIIDNYPTNTLNTTAGVGSVGIFCPDTPDYNVNIIENTYNGNTNLEPSTNNPFGYDSTNNSEFLGPNGFVWLQGSGNCFIARNIIQNNELEAVQLNAGPSSLVGNTFITLISDGSCCALNAFSAPGASGATGFDPINFSTCFIGNSVYGGRYGELGSCVGQTPVPYTINFSGNELTLYPAFHEFDANGDPDDYPGAPVLVQDCTAAAVCGNTLVTGGHGVVFGTGCGSALIMNNNFANATYRGIGLFGSTGSAQTATIVNNIIGQGASFHSQVPAANSFGWFFYQNQYLNAASNSVPPFFDPIGSAVHVSP